MNNWQNLLVLVLGIGFLTALSRKWCLPGLASGLLIIFGTIAAAAAGLFLARVGLPFPVVALGMWTTQLAGYTVGLLYQFYRDPERRPPNESDALLSPADGKVIYIKKLPAGQILESEKKGRRLVLSELSGTDLSTHELWQIGISMVFTDVHVNRAPIEGRVTMVKHRPGAFLSLRKEEATNVNERQTMMIEKNGLQIALVQIASRLVRRIEAYVSEGEEVVLGQRIGIIKFGSQVDLFVPVAALSALNVKLDQQLTAGETIIGRAKRDTTMKLADAGAGVAVGARP